MDGGKFLPDLYEWQLDVREALWVVILDWRLHSATNECIRGDASESARQTCEVSFFLVLLLVLRLSVIKLANEMAIMM